MKYMELPAKFKIDEEYVPPRCFKPRYRKAIRETKVRIPLVTAEEAPVAMWHSEGIRGLVHYYRKNYRLYQGDLYTRSFELSCGRDHVYQTLSYFKKNVETQYQYDYVRDENYYFVNDVQKACECVQNAYSDYLLIQFGQEIQVWEKTGEPRYEIHTMGLGHNHSPIGVSISISNYYNGNIGKGSYFTALQYEDAVKTALDVAKARGDTKSYDFIRNSYRIRVLIPDAVKCNPAEEAGDGDKFMNALESIVQNAESCEEAGAMVMTYTAKSVGRNRI